MARRRERAQRDRRLEKLAIEVLTATGEREATIAATEQRAGAALQAMITGESLTVSEAAVVRRSNQSSEATRLRHPTAGTQQPGDSSWGVVVFRWFMTPRASAVPSGRGLLAGSRRRQTHFPARSAGESVKPR